MTSSILSRICGRLANYTVFFLIFVPALVFSPWNMSSFEIPKTALFLMIAIWLVVFFILFRLENRVELNKGQKVALGLAGLLVVVKLLSLMFSLDPWYSFWGSYTRAEGTVLHLGLIVFFVVLVNIMKSERMIRYYLLTVSFTAGLIATYGDFQKFGMDFKSLVWDKAAYIRIASTLGNPLFLSMFMMFAIGYTIYNLFVWKNIYLRLALGACLIAQTMALIFTFTSSSVVAMAAAGAFLFCVFFWNRKRWLSYLTIGAVIVGFVFSLLIATETLSTPFTDRVFADFSLNNLSNLQRINAWQAGWTSFKQHPILGWGQELFLPAFTLNKNANFVSPWETNFDRAHNMYFDVLAMEGIFAFLLYFGLIGYGLFYSVKKYFSEKNYLFLITATLLVAYLVNFAFSIPTIMSFVMLYFTLAVVFHSEEDEKQWRVSGSKDLYYERYLAAYIVLPILAIYLTYTFFRPWGADLDFMKASRDRDLLHRITAVESVIKKWPMREYEIELFKLENNLMAQAKTKSPQVFIEHEKNIEILIDNMLERKPYDVLTNMVAAVYWGGTDRDKMEYYFAEALKNGPRHYDLYWLWGDTYVEFGEKDKAIEKYQAAIDLTPSRSYPYFMMGKLYDRLGDKAKAAEYTAKSKELKSAIN